MAKILSKGYTGRMMLLVNEATGEAVEEGAILLSDRAEYKLISGTAPHKSSSTGRVYVEEIGKDFKRELYPSVFNLKWIDAEQQNKSDDEKLSYFKEHLIDILQHEDIELDTVVKMLRIITDEYILTRSTEDLEFRLESLTS